MKTKSRLMYIDNLKVIAIFTIIFSHVCIIARQSAVLGIPFRYFQQIGKVGVPLFLMISGALLLNRHYGSVNEFLSKKSSRIVLPFLLWMNITILVIIYLNNLPLNSDTLIYSINTFFNLGVNWYFWMIIGTYLAIPIINEYILSKGIDGAGYFIKIFLIASVIYQICKIFEFDSYIDLTFFIGPISYLILGFYLDNRKFNISKNKLIIISFLLFCLCFALRIANPTIPFKATYLFLPNSDIHLLSYLDISVVGIIECSSLFIFFKSVDESVSGIGKKLKDFLSLKVIKKFNLSISKASYGMYLTHMYLVMIVFAYFDLLPLTGTQMAELVAILSIIVFLLSWISVLIVSKIPYLNKFSGYS